MLSSLEGICISCWCVVDFGGVSPPYGILVFGEKVYWVQVYLHVVGRGGVKGVDIL